MRRSGAIAAAVSALTVGALGGCGDDDEGTRVRPETTGEGPGVGVGDRDSDIGIRDFEFSPDLAAIPAGASVEWTNRGEVAHTVTWSSGPGDHFDSGPIAPGTNYRRGFPTNGLIKYRCTIHPEMTGSVRVYR